MTGYDKMGNILGLKRYGQTSSTGYDVIDDLFEEVKQELIELIRNHADEGEQAVDLLMVTKYFERIGDHATNIAEWVIFSITGQIAG